MPSTVSERFTKKFGWLGFGVLFGNNCIRLVWLTDTEPIRAFVETVDPTQNMVPRTKQFRITFNLLLIVTFKCIS